MYKAFFQLARYPFELTPDPAFLLPTKPHNEALAVMYYGIRRQSGIVVVTGEVGTGKTLLLHCLLRELQGSKDIAFAYLANTLTTSSDFFGYVLAYLGCPAFTKSKGELLFDLSRILIERGRKGLTTVLIVDEAHNISVDLLEEIRMLNNLETPEKKLLQVMLVGQPELNAKLDAPELRALKQRVALRGRLRLLDQGETRSYVEQRLRVAGLKVPPTKLFSAQAMERIFRYSRGAPRSINTICENCLIVAYARQSSTVTPEIVDETARDLRLHEGACRFHRSFVERNAFPAAEVAGDNDRGRSGFYSVT